VYRLVDGACTEETRPTAGVYALDDTGAPIAFVAGDVVHD